MSETNLFFVAALVASTALAAPGSEAEVVQAVVEHNPTVRASVVDLQRTAETVRAEAARWRPRLLLDGTATQQATPNLNTQGGTTTQTSQALTFGAQLDQQFSFGTVLSLRLENKTSRLEGPLFSGSTDTFTLGPGYGLSARLGVTQPLLRGFGDDVGLAQADLVERAHLALAGAVDAAQLAQLDDGGRGVHRALPCSASVMTSAPASRPSPCTSVDMPSLSPRCTTTRSGVPARSTHTCGVESTGAVLVPSGGGPKPPRVFCTGGSKRSAALGTSSTALRSSVCTVTVAVMPGRSSCRRAWSSSRGAPAW